MKKGRIALFALLAAAILAPGSYAQRRYTEDQNGDGRISRSEWTGNRRAFNRHDRNGDGFLDESELPPGLRKRIFDNRNDRARNGQYGEASRLDRNRSGVVEGYEWPYNARLFNELDRDGNNVLSTDELARISTATVRELDRNRDGRIETNEWPGGFAKFDDLDADKNGAVSAQEYFNRGGEWQRRQRFSDWDRNRDGFVEFREWKSSRDLFRRLDRDNDNRVSWNEFMASTDRYDGPFGWLYGMSQR